MRHLIFILGLILCLGCDSNTPNKNPDKKGSSNTSTKITKNGWNLEKGYRWKELKVPAIGKTGFKLLSSKETDIKFFNDLKDSEVTKNQILQSGSGVATGDFNGDGLCDIYFCRLSGENVLYQNLGGWKFKNVAKEAGVECPNQFSTGATFADIDGDSDLDLIVTCIGNLNTCFINDGKGKFTPSENAGLLTNLGSMSFALADAEGDGDLDLYITNYRTTTFKDFGKEITLQLTKEGQFVIPPQLQNRLVIQGEMFLPKEDLPRFFVDGKFTVPTDYKNKISFTQQIKEYGEVDVLYINDGKGAFTPRSFLDGTFLDEDGKKLTETPKDWGLAVIFRDIDGDSDPDLYVCNDFWSPDRIWINQGNGTFRAIDRLAIRSISTTSMGVDFADINRDGKDDFFVADMLSRNHTRRKMQMGSMKPTPIDIGSIDNRPQVMRNTMFINRGDDTYAEIALYSEVQDTDWSWSPVFFDADLDGYEDLFVTNGHARDVQDSDTSNRIKGMEFGSMDQKRQTLLMYPRLSTKNVFFRNEGDCKFKEVGESWGTAQQVISHGVALADFDQDGDLDFVTNNLYTPVGVYRNETVAPRIAVRLKGNAPNTQGIGAKITLKGAVVEQAKEVICGGRYLSGSDPLLTFAPGKTVKGLSLEVLWRNGQKSVITNVKPNCLYEIEESSAKPFTKKAPEKITPVFKEVSAKIAHSHHENEFDDFKYQSLLPNRFSQLGPGNAWYDVNGDSHEDLIVGSGKDGMLRIFLGDGKGNFKVLTSDTINQKTNRDQTSILATRDAAGNPTVFVGNANFEDATSEGSAAMQYTFQKENVVAKSAVPAQSSSTGPMAMADVDGDGDLDLFVGDRTLAKRYPEACSSRLFLNQDGVFSPDPQNTAKFENIGLVSGAVFSDLDNDGDPDLVLALEWGPVTVYLNEKGSFANATDKLKLGEYLGWWNSVTTGDFDNDGKLDILAMNWGLNSKYHYSKDHPLKVYFSDFDGNGSLDIVEAHYDKKMGTTVPERGLSCSSRCMPFIREKLSTYKKYGEATLKDIYGDALKTSPVLAANELAHKIFFNRGDHFEAVSLPTEAQFSPGFGVNVADFDGDGAEDIFIAQNFYASQIETPRIDAGRGLWLKGNGKGDFTPVPGQHSGIKVYGDSRGSSVADFNGDGRVDLVVSQNGAATKLYENVTAVPGLRIRLKGKAQNYDAIGAKLQILSNGYKGPVRELHGGSGYWSQDSLVQIMHVPQGAKKPQVRIQWPGGQETTVEIPANAKEVIIGIDGKLEVAR